MLTGNRRVLKLTAKPCRQGSDSWIICWSINQRECKAMDVMGGNNTNNLRINTDPKGALFLRKDNLKWPGKSSENFYSVWQVKTTKLMLDFQEKKLGTECNCYASISMVFCILKLYHFCHPSQKDVVGRGKKGKEQFISQNSNRLS